MATVSVLTAERMLEIEAESIVDANLVGDDLVLVRHDGTTIDVGSIRGPQGVPGPADVNSVKLTGAQTIAGVKTFSNIPVVPANSFPESAIVNLVADLAAKAADAVVVKVTGAQTIAGVKTFSSAPVVPAGSFPETAITNLVADLAAKASDSSVVHNTGAQTIAGIKTFSSMPVFPGQTWHLVGAAGEPAFLSGWSNYGAGFQPLRFCKDALGFVHIEGLVKNVGASITTIFTLPAGYRPANTITMGVMANGTDARMDINNVGEVYITTYDVGGNSDYLSPHVCFYPG